jgi:hypothetical protein
VLTDQQVLRLDIPVDDMFLVQVRQSIGHLRNVLGNCKRQRDPVGLEQLTLLLLFSSNLPYFESCLYSSPFAANSRMRKIRFESWK